MLTGFSFSNYRAFRTGEIELRPLTILLGSNGVGKTSLMQLLLLLRQTTEASGTGYRSPLRLQGKDVQFGDATNIFFNHDTRRNIGISLHGEVSELQNDFRGRLVSEFSDLLEEYAYYIYRTLSIPGADPTGELEREFSEYRNNYLHRGPRGRSRKGRPTARAAVELIRRYSDKIDNLVSPALPQFDPSSIFSRRSLYRPPVFDSGRPTSSETLSQCLSMLEAMDGFDITKSTLSFQIGRPRGGSLVIREIKLTAGSKNIVSISSRQTNRPSQVRSDLFSFPGSTFNLPATSNLLDPTATIFECINPRPDKISDFRTELCRHLLRSAIDSFRRAVQPELVNHVPPLRAYPKRYYFLDYAMPAAGRGDAVVESLRENATLKHSVNKWLHRFGLSVSVSQFEELIHKLKVSKSGVGFELDIADVGFGISQILPVVVQCFLARQNSFTVIEQPEIHLHPKMQADLADLFIEVLGGAPDKTLVVETHSEYLLNRLRRRIAEGAISRDDVAIYFVEPDHTDSTEDAGAAVRRIDVSHDGAFDWPTEFFESDLEDTISFLMLKSGDE